MNPYPTENSLTINNTHQMLSSLESDAERIAATSPTRKAEKGLGYDVECSFVKRLQFQYKRPQYIHSERGLCFEVNSDQVATLRFRDEVRVSYLVCPYVTNRSQLNDTLENSYFIDVQAVRANTTRLFIPKNYPNGKPITARYNDDDTSYYYEIPQHAVLVWSNIESTINSHAIGQVVRENGTLTPPYREFVKRLSALKNLYDPSKPVMADGGEDIDEGRELNEEARQRLINHARREHLSVYEEYIISEEELNETVSQDTIGLEETISNMEHVQDRQVHRIRRSRELIYESGSADEKLSLGKMSSRDQSNIH